MATTPLKSAKLTRLPPWTPAWPNQSNQVPSPRQAFGFRRRSSLGLGENDDDSYFRLSLQSMAPQMSVVDETDPLLPRKQSPKLPEKPAPAKTPPGSAGPPWRDVAVCALAYFLGSLFVFNPRLSGLIEATGSKHLVATVTVWFHPARPFGNTLEVFRYTAFMLSLALGIAMLSIFTSYFLVNSGFAIVNNVVMLLVFIGGGMGVIGFLKMRVNNASFNTACSSAIMFLVNLLLKEDDLQRGVLPFPRLRALFSMVLIGALISTLVSLLFRRQYATDLVAKDADEAMRCHAVALRASLGQFLNSTPIDPSVDAAAHKTLKKMSQHLSYSRLELSLTKNQSRQYGALSELSKSLKRQSLHLGGLLHCIKVKSQLLSMNSDSSPDQPGRVSAEILFDSFLYHLGPALNKFGEQIAKALIIGRAEGLDQASKEYAHLKELALHSVYNHRLFGPGGRGSRGNAGTLGASSDEALVATCAMFSTLVLDFAGEVQTVLRLRAGDMLPSPEPLVETPAEEPFSKVTEALYPTQRRSGMGLGPTLWRLLRLLRRVDVQHGIRVGIGAVVISAPTFIPKARDIFHMWHGEWAVITYMLIMARNLGAMRKNIPLRIAGTCTGALVAVAVSTLFRVQPVLLALSGAIVAWFCFRKILSDKNPVLGRFVLLTYNLVCLYGYSVRNTSPGDLPGNDNPEILAPIYDVAFHRVFAVLSGVLWAVFITVSIWPHSARRALRTNLSTQWMRMGMAWRADPVQHQRGVAGESELQNMMLELESLLDQSPSEFRLRGKWDPEPYHHLVKDTQIILDAFHSIALMTGGTTPQELDLIQYTQLERAELASTLFLYFYTASASIRMGFPVPEHLPQLHDSVARFVTKLRERRALSLKSADCDSDDFVLLYSYLMATHTISDRLRHINDALRHVFGALDADLFSYV